jgi:prepilin-type N-terminal cleavage/methylation domain-containing protein
MKIINKQFKSGFTLIETLVSLALFSIVLVIVGGTIVSIIDINKRNQLISAVVNNLNYSIDSMVRDIKTGYLYKCNYTESFTMKGLKDSLNKGEDSCDNDKGLTLISTISGVDTVVNYKWKTVEGGNGYLEKTVYENETGVASAYSITDKNNVNIESVKFTVTNPDALDCDDTDGECEYGQPAVFVVIKGKAGNQTIEVSRFYVQTFISQRVVNITDFKD